MAVGSCQEHAYIILLYFDYFLCEFDSERNDKNLRGSFMALCAAWGSERPFFPALLLLLRQRLPASLMG